MAGPNVGFATLSIIPSMRGAQAAMSSQIAGPAGAVGQQAGGTMGGSMSKALGTALKAGIGGALAAGGVAVGLAKLGGSFDEQFDKIRIGTGATGDALEGLQDSFKNVLKGTATDFDSAGSAIAQLNQRLGLTGVPLERTAKQILDLSRITDTDLATNVDNLTRVFGDWGITLDDQPERLDQIFRAAQASGIGLADLSSSVVQFGAPLRNLGFGLDESLALLAQFNKTGVNTNTVFAGLKAGVGKLAKAGEDVPTTFRRIVAEIKKMGPGTRATAKAIELFGQRAGPDLADAIAGGKFSIDEMMASIADGSDTIASATEDTADFSEKWTIFKNKVLVVLEPIATRVFNAIGDAMDGLSDWWDQHGGAVLAGFEDVKTAVSDFVEDALVVMKEWWDDNGPEITETVKGLAEDFDRYVLGPLTAVAEFIKEHLLPRLGDFITWILKNKTVLEGLGILVGVTLVAHFATLAFASITAAVTSAAAWAAAVAPLTLMILTVLALYAAMTWIMRQKAFSDFLQWWIDLGEAVWNFLAVLAAVIPQLQALFDLANNLVDLLPFGPSEAKVDPLADIFAKEDAKYRYTRPLKPIFADGGVMPGPLGVHSLAWVAGGETILPTHRADFDARAFKTGGAVNTWNIYNPEPETASESILTSSRRAAALLGA